MPSAGRLRRAVVSGSFALVLAVLFFGYSDMLGRPKAARLELFRNDMTNAEVISAVFKEGDGIFLLAAAAHRGRAALLQAAVG